MIPLTDVKTRTLKYLLKRARLRADHYHRAGRLAAVREAEALMEVERVKAELEAAENAERQATS